MRLTVELIGDDLRIRSLLARDKIRLETARQWRARGWRPVTDEC